MTADRRITASQVGQYAYCSCAWWLATVEGRLPENPQALAEGQQAHRRHGAQVLLVLILRRLAWTAFGLALLMLLVGSLIAFH